MVLKIIVRTFLLSAGLLAVLVGTYFYLFVLPGWEIRRGLYTLAHAEREVGRRRDALIENRLALTALTRLNADAPLFDSDRAYVISQMAGSVQRAQELVSQPLSLPPGNVGLPESVERLLADLRRELPTLLERYLATLERQAPLATRVAAFDKKVEKIFRYEARADLGDFNSKEGGQLLIERSRAARAGLQTLHDRLGEPEGGVPGERELQGKIRQTMVKLAELARRLSAGEAAAAEVLKEEVVHEFSALKQLALALEIGVVMSDEWVVLLTDQTNLIGEYDAWLRRIGELRQALEDRVSAGRLILKAQE